MPIQFTIQYKNGETEIKTLNKEKIDLGRNPDNDIVLKTDEVSRKHASIVFRHGVAYFLCPGKFGATLNDRKLVPGEEPTIAAGARLEICGNILTVDECSAPVPQDNWALPYHGGEGTNLPPDLPSPPRAHSTAMLDEAGILAKELDALYRKNVMEDLLVRQERLKGTLKERLAKFDANGREEMIELVKERFSTRDEVWKRLIRQDNERTMQEGKEKATINALEKVAARLTENARPFQEADVAVFCENLGQTLELLLNFFRDLEAGRQIRFTNDATQIALGPVSLREASSARQLGSLLLDWSNPQRNRNARAQFDGVLRELLAHEQALKTSYEEGLRQVSNRLFKRLDPETLEKQVGDEKLQFRFFKIPWKLLGPLQGWRWWRKYTTAYQELKERESATLREWFENELERVYQRKMNAMLAEFNADRTAR